jgi:hypothetical protein
MQSYAGEHEGSVLLDLQDPFGFILGRILFDRYTVRANGDGLRGNRLRGRRLLHRLPEDHNQQAT